MGVGKGNKRPEIAGLRDLVVGGKVQVVDSAMQPLAVGTVRWVHPRATNAQVEWIAPDRSYHKRSFFLRSGLEMSDAGDRYNGIVANRSIRPMAAQ